jgi:cell division protein FtsN
VSNGRDVRPGSLPNSGRLTSRDFKRPARRTFDLPRFRDFGTGVLVGLAAATLLFAWLRDRADDAAQATRPEPRRLEAPAADVAAADDPAADYDFYEMLPKFEVVIPERDRDVSRELPAAPISRPGVYVLQAGSYRNAADAERVRKQLALTGIEAKVQRVAVDTDVWHRVRIGPVGDLAELNRLRRQLQAADVDALVIRVGD